MPFNLDKAIAAWRRAYEVNPTFSAEDIEELESNLRDRVEALTTTGKTEKEAFNIALKRMGSYGSVEQEYGKVFWGKVKREQRVLDEVIWRLTMLKNYFKVALRSVRKQKGYAFINIFSLTTGLFCFLLIFLFTRHELSYDLFHDNSSNIYRVYSQTPGNSFLGSDYFAVTPIPLAQALKRNFPEVTAATGFRNSDAFFRVDDNTYPERGILADEYFFEVFTFPLLRGNSATALVTPNAIVLTESLARKLFGDRDPIGETVLSDQTAFEITGVAADVPDNSSIQFSFIASFLTNNQYAQSIEQNLWDRGYANTYLVLEEESDPKLLEAKLSEKSAAFIFAQEEKSAQEDSRNYLLQQLRDLHLRSHFNFEDAFTGDIQQVFLFLGIAVLTLLIACINYVNLAIARSMKRVHEVGARKAIGAMRSQLMAQFLGESILIAFAALVLAVGLIYLLLPFFSQFMQRPISIEFGSNFMVLLGLVLLVLSVGIISGSYPAYLVSSVLPVQALKGKLGLGAPRLKLQQGLIVTQYTASIILIAIGVVIYSQMRYVENKDLGYQSEQVFTIPLNGEDLQQNYSALRTEWLANPSVSYVTTSSSLPSGVDWIQSITLREGRTKDEELEVAVQEVGYDYLNVFGIELIAGRNFSPRQKSGAVDEAIINERAAQALGWFADDAPGKVLTRDGEEEYTVIGVMKDFHFQSMHLPITPLVLYPNDIPYGFISAKIRANQISETVELLGASYESLTARPFDYQFMSERLDHLYVSERRLGKSLFYFTMLALLIASLGLYGLAAYATEQRIKEIGIRKVLGASVGNVVMLLTKDFTKLVAIAAMLATPLAYIAARQWLSSFTYSIELGVEIFVLTSLMALLIALLSVSYQSIRAALADPVKSLRYE